MGEKKEEEMREEIREKGDNMESGRRDRKGSMDGRKEEEEKEEEK